MRILAKDGETLEVVASLDIFNLLSTDPEYTCFHEL